MRHRLSPRDTVAVVIWGTITVPGSIARDGPDDPCDGDAVAPAGGPRSGADAGGPGAISRAACRVGPVAVSAPGGTADIRGVCAEGPGCAWLATAPPPRFGSRGTA